MQQKASSNGNQSRRESSQPGLHQKVGTSPLYIAMHQPTLLNLKRKRPSTNIYKQSPKNYRRGISKLLWGIRKLQNAKIRQELGITLRNRFQALEEGKNIDEKWARCKNAITDTCEQVLGCWEARRKDWITDDTWEAIEAMRETKMKLNKEADDTRKKKLQQEYQ